MILEPGKCQFLDSAYYVRVSNVCLLRDQHPTVAVTIACLTTNN